LSRVRVAALYDVHGNLPALEAVLDEAERQDASLIVVGGDVAAGPSPEECVATLRALGERVVWIRGNADRELAAGTASSPAIEVTPPVSDELRAFLGGLPPTAELEIDGLGDVLFCHAIPRDDETIVTAETPAEFFDAAFGAAGADVVVCGHTHMQYDRTTGTTRVVNAGSVGMPYEHEPGAYWALLGPTVDLRRTPYDGAGVEATREEATRFFEQLAVERGERGGGT
jgi:putative phosphoesterase